MLFMNLQKKVIQSIDVYEGVLVNIISFFVTGSCCNGGPWDIWSWQPKKPDRCDICELSLLIDSLSQVVFFPINGNESLHIIFQCDRNW